MILARPRRRLPRCPPNSWYVCPAYGSHRLQLQERLGEQIADEISRITGTQNVAVVLKGEHYCMAARGIRMPGRMTSSVMRGVFRTESQIRMEFLRLIE